MMAKNILSELREFITERFDLSFEKENEQETMEQIKRGVEFRGSTLWVLIFAIFVASLGLNTNSTAVIIGAMLISPLMGPIMGIGLGVGIYDLELIKKSFKNLMIATLFSIITAAFYFTISPISEAKSELLARTTPTTYDVLIAFFGGMAGIVAGSVKGRGGNVIPGVAIATALMPPLCTAGYGLATGNFSFFVGAFYLYFINSVFISLATYIGVRILKFPQKQIVDPIRAKKVRQTIMIVVTLTLAPSLWMSYQMVMDNVFETKLSEFVSKELKFPSSEIFKKEITTNGRNRAVSVVLIGESVDQKNIDHALSKRVQYGLEDVAISVDQGLGTKSLDVNSLKIGLLQDLYNSNQQQLKLQQSEIDSLNMMVAKHRERAGMTTEIGREIKPLFPFVKEVIVGEGSLFSMTDEATSGQTVVVLSGDYTQIKKEEDRIAEWLKVRMASEKLILIVQK